MRRAYWTKGVACLGTAVVLSMASCVTLGDATATGLCRETEMAGLSLSLDRYYTATYESTEADVSTGTSITAENVVTDASAPEETVGATPSAVASAVAVEAATQESTKPVARAKKQEKKAKVSKRYENLGISIAGDYVNIRKHPSTDSKILGKLYEGSAAKILSSKGDWVKIKSGSVTGYINKEFLAIGAQAQALADKYGIKHASVKSGVITLNVRAKTSTKSIILTQIPEDEQYLIVKETDNWAKICIDDGAEGYVAKEFIDIKVSYKHAISIQEEKEKIARRKAAEKAQQERLEQLAREKAEKEAAQKKEAAKQETGKSTSSGTEKKTTTSKTNSTSSSKSSTSSKNTSSTKSSTSSKNTSSSKSSTSSKNTSSSKSNTSSKNTSSSKSSTNSKNTSASVPSTGSDTGSEIANYAKKFVGNPYVYGGTSLTNGTDCSGFTMSIYAQFGYSIPRTSRGQSTYGTSVSLSDVRPGDLIFYKNGSTVGHVALYIGGGQVVHASNPSDGIKISGMYYRRPCWARRVVS